MKRQIEFTYFNLFNDFTVSLVTIYFLKFKNLEHYKSDFISRHISVNHYGDVTANDWVQYTVDLRVLMHNFSRLAMSLQ